MPCLLPLTDRQRASSPICARVASRRSIRRARRQHCVLAGKKFAAGQAVATAPRYSMPDRGGGRSVRQQRRQGTDLLVRARLRQGQLDAARNWGQDRDEASWRDLVLANPEPDAFRAGSSSGGGPTAGRARFGRVSSRRSRPSALPPPALPPTPPLRLCRRRRRARRWPWRRRSAAPVRAAVAAAGRAAGVPPSARHVPPCSVALRAEPPIDSASAARPNTTNLNSLQFS